MSRAPLAHRRLPCAGSSPLVLVARASVAERHDALRRGAARRALRGERVWRLDLAGTRVTRVTSSYAGSFGRLRTAVRSRDGSLWLLTANGSDDRVLRIARP